MDMALTRRQFVAAACCGVALGGVGCGDSDRRRGAVVPDLAGEPFNIGGPERYRRPGVYDRYALTKGVYLVTSNYGMLVALAAICTCLDKPVTHGEPGDGIADSVKRYSVGDDATFPPGYNPDACRVIFDAISRQYRCPCHGSRYSSDGLPRQGGPAVRALERCLIRVTGTRAQPDGGLVVDPRHRYRHESKTADHWSNPNSVYMFEDRL